MQDGISASAVGPSTIFPRGFLWQTPFWLLAAFAGLAIAHLFPLWLRGTLAVGLLGVTFTFLCALSVIEARAFAVDHAGIRIGLPASSRRRGHRRRAPVLVSWPQVDRVRIRHRRRAVQLDVVLTSGAAKELDAYRHSLVARIWRALLLLIPFWYLRRATGIATPSGEPPRYRLVLRGVTVERLRQELRALAPPDVAVTVMVPKGASVSSATSAPGTTAGPAYPASRR